MGRVVSGLCLLWRCAGGRTEEAGVADRCLDSRPVVIGGVWRAWILLCGYTICLKALDATFRAIRAAQSDWRCRQLAREGGRQRPDKAAR